jgi:hypothetical protein
MIELVQGKRPCSFIESLGGGTLVLKHGSARQVDPEFNWSGAGTKLGWKKQGKKTRCNPAGWPDKTQSKTRLQPIKFSFF